MTFIEKIKAQLEEPRNLHARLRKDGRVTVSANALLELVHHFERLDNEMRERYYKEQEREDGRKPNPPPIQQHKRLS